MCISIVLIYLDLKTHIHTYIHLFLVSKVDGALYLSPAEDTLRRLGFRAVVEAVGVGETWVGVTDGRLTREVVVPSPPPSSYALLTQPRRDRSVGLTMVFLATSGEGEFFCNASPFVFDLIVFCFLLYLYYFLFMFICFIFFVLPSLPSSYSFPFPFSLTIRKLPVK